MSNEEKEKSLVSEKEASQETTQALPLPKKFRTIYSSPIPGCTWNPLLTLPPNMLCPCRSERKFKHCCKKTLPRVVTIKTAEEYKKQMAKPDLIFVTRNNEQALRTEGKLSSGVESDEGSDVKTDQNHDG